MTLTNKTLFQTFEWHTESRPPATHETHASTSHYARLLRILPSLCELGLNALWLPPGCKANVPEGNGYDCYDLWDLGEFDSKFARSTKWGSVEELRELIEAAHSRGLQIIWDAVLNHKTSGDTTEETWAVEVDPEDRRIEICPPKKIVAWLKYEFPGRGDTYSPLRWRAEHFNGTDWDQASERHAIYKLIDDPATYPKLRRFLSKKRPGKGWAEDVSKMHGNYDYLLFSNIDHKHPAVRADLMAWAEWMLLSTKVDGFRLDAVQHFSYAFSREWIARVQACKSAFVVGEVWSPNVRDILEWLDAVGQGTYAYDSPLVYNMSAISDGADLRNITRGSLVGCRPHAAVTVVSNHDTQHGQASFVPMDPQLKILFYAFILLRAEGQPCVFWGDLLGIKGPHPEPPCARLPDLILARHLFAYGEQTDIRCEGLAWERAGTHDKPGCIVLISLKDTQITKRSSSTWTDILSGRQVVNGTFFCPARSAAVFVQDASRFPVSWECSNL